MPIIKGSGPIDKVINVASAIVNHLSSALPILNDEQREERLKICKECDSFEGGRCKECGCYMIVKASLPLSECPLKKWGIHPMAQQIIDEHNKNKDVKIGECDGCQ